MGVFARMDQWTHEHNTIALDIVRFAVGLFIFLKGVFFVRNMEYLEGLMYDANMDFAYPWVTHYVVFAHVAGGMMIAFGLLTRWVALLLLPILIGAVFMVNISRNVLDMELVTSIVTLLLLVGLVIYGSGHFSIDEFLERDY